MTCSECEQLFDAYLDGNLSGSLRLEFDAHRLRCRRCQETLAMLEAVGHVLASDPDVPPLSDDFTDRVMAGLPARRAPRRTIAFPRRRVAVVSAALVQAAAVLTFAVLWHEHYASSQPMASDASDTVVADASLVSPAGDPGQEALRDLIFEKLEDRIWNMHAAGQRLSNDLVQLAAYANITLPDEVVQESEEMAGGGMFGLLRGLVVPPPQASDESPPPTDELHSL